MTIFLRQPEHAIEHGFRRLQDCPARPSRLHRTLPLVWSTRLDKRLVSRVDTALCYRLFVLESNPSCADKGGAFVW